MKIVYLSNYYYPSPGGAENYVRNLARIMSQKHKVIVVTLCRSTSYSIQDVLTSRKFSQVRAESLDENIDVITVNPSPVTMTLLSAVKFSFLLQSFLPRKFYYINRAFWIHYIAYFIAPYIKPILRDADIVHSISPWEISHAANLVKQDVTPHVITGLTHTGFWGDDFNSLLHFGQCNHLVSLTQTEKHELENLGINSRKISVIGVPFIKSPESNSANLPEEICESDTFVLFLGVKREYKGIELLLSAFKIVWEEFPSIKLVLAGPRTSYSHSLSEKFQSDPRLIEIDTINESQKWGLLNSCYCLCLPSATEIMPNVILEAWSCKKAVITSDIPNLREIVIGAGLFTELKVVSLTNSILRLLREPMLTHELGQEGYRRVATDFSSAFIASQIESLYLQLTRD